MERRVLPLLVFALAMPSCFGGQSYDDGSDALGSNGDTSVAPSLRAPDPCDGCYVVNSAVTVNARGEWYVASYFGAGVPERRLLRRYERGEWQTLSRWAPGSSVEQMWASEAVVWGASQDGMWRLDVDGEERIPESLGATSVWALSDDDVFALDGDTLHRRREGEWSQEQLDLDGDEPLSIRGAAPWEDTPATPLFLVGVRGTVWAYGDEGWEELSAAVLDVELNDVAVRGSELWAVSGSDHPDGTTGPAALHRFSDGSWEEVERHASDVLLGVEVAGDRAIAVGARRNGSGTAHAVVWRLDGEDFERVELAALEGFLWDVACDAEGTCFAAGADNAFVEVDTLP